MRCLISIIISLLFFSCRESFYKKEYQYPYKLNIIRLDEKFYDQSYSLDSLFASHNMFFPNQVSDSIWIAKRNDSLEIAINLAVKELKISDLDLENLIYPILARTMNLVDTSLKIQKIYTVFSNFDFQNKVILNDTLIIIGLDNFLGQNSKYYQGIYDYLRIKFDSKFLEYDISEKIIQNSIAQISSNKTFIEKLIYHGKVKWLQSLILENSSDSLLFGFTSDQLIFCEENEFEIWNYFVQNDLLYSKDRKLDNRFLMQAPFSKFYNEVDQKTPGEIGKWIGYKIVKKYVERENVTSLELVHEKNYLMIFNKSKYKPKSW